MGTSRRKGADEASGAASSPKMEKFAVVEGAHLGTRFNSEQEAIEALADITLVMSGVRMHLVKIIGVIEGQVVRRVRPVE